MLFCSFNKAENLKNSDYIIPLAWPEVMVQTPGGWDDSITYLSHCSECNILQNKTEYKFKLIENEH